MSGLWRVFDSNEGELRRLRKIAQRVNALEETAKAFTDDELRRRTELFRERLAKDETLDDLLPEAFAAVREAARRHLGQRHFDVQLLGGMALHKGHIAEAKTGAGWMAPIYHSLGMSVAYIAHEKSAVYDPAVVLEAVDPRHQHWRDVLRRDAYLADITYGQNSEFGFDYLRDNMVDDLANVVQRELNFAIVDEADSILIDEARTPLIISSPAEDSAELYYRFASVAEKLNEGSDYVIEEKHKAVTLTEEGVTRAERLLNIPNIYEGDVSAVHYLDNAVKAKALYLKDREYVVKDGEVVIVDEFTGRLMPGRRWSDGLHQAVEAKEGVKIERENQTLATITFQNYFRMYKKLAGMTGTAATEAAEFSKIYNLEVTIIPTNQTLIRIESPDVVYRTEKEKFEAVVNGILQEDNSLANGIRHYHERGQPVLVGTISIEKSETIAELLKKSGIPHQVLNAKQHERESRVVAQAGRKGAVTVATNM